ncbi:hypothetical protein ABIB30_000776 [Pedobacter sp. UYP1]
MHHYKAGGLMNGGFGSAALLCFTSKNHSQYQPLIRANTNTITSS